MKQEHENKSLNNFENKSQEPETKEQKDRKEQKDERGGNHNPKGANQYTSGRVDDRGRKDLEEATSPAKQGEHNDRPQFGEQQETIAVVERETDPNENQ